MYGGFDRDFLFSDGEADTLYGGRGDDYIEVQGGGDDYVDCGEGFDKVLYDDPGDTVENCERLVPH